MKTILTLTILFSVSIALPGLGELTDADLNEIRLLVKEEVQTEIREFNVKIDDNFRSLEKRFESIEKNFDRQNPLIIAKVHRHSYGNSHASDRLAERQRQLTREKN